MGGYHMKKRKYTQMKAIEQEIERMHMEGATSREIGEQFGLEKEQIHNWISRYNRKQRQLMAGKELRPKGRPRKDGQSPHQDETTELKRLRMENQLLRDFLCSIERGSGQD